MNVEDMSEGNNLGGFSLLAPPPHLCQKCAVDHHPDQPHNNQSLYWQYWFREKHGRWPTWHDAMAHCSEEIKNRWIVELTKLGVKL